MIILSIRTDQPEAEVALYDGTAVLDTVRWTAHRQLAETIHTRMEELLLAHDYDWSSLDGIAVYQGPGSFTGLRIGIGVANALAYGLDVPVAGAVGSEWPQTALRALTAGTPQAFVVPEYGAPVHITAPRK